MNERVIYQLKVVVRLLLTVCSGGVPVVDLVPQPQVLFLQCRYLPLVRLFEILALLFQRDKLIVFLLQLLPHMHLLLLFKLGHLVQSRHCSLYLLLENPVLFLMRRPSLLGPHSTLVYTPVLTAHGADLRFMGAHCSPIHQVYLTIYLFPFVLQLSLQVLYPHTPLLQLLLQFLNFSCKLTVLALQLGYLREVSTIFPLQVVHRLLKLGDFGIQQQNHLLLLQQFARQLLQGGLEFTIEQQNPCVLFEKEIYLRSRPLFLLTHLFPVLFVLACELRVRILEGLDQRQKMLDGLLVQITHYVLYYKQEPPCSFIPNRQHQLSIHSDCSSALSLPWRVVYHLYQPDFLQVIFLQANKQLDRKDEIHGQLNGSTEYCMGWEKAMKQMVLLKSSRNRVIIRMKLRLFTLFCLMLFIIWEIPVCLSREFGCGAIRNSNPFKIINIRQSSVNQHSSKAPREHQHRCPESSSP